MPAKTRQTRAHAAKSPGVGIMARVVSQQQDQYRGVFRWYMAQAWAHITQRRLLPLTLSMTMYIVVDFEVMSNVRGMWADESQRGQSATKRRPKLYHNTDAGTFHDALDLLASASLLLRVGLRMHIYNFGHSKLPNCSITQYLELAMSKNRVFVIYFIQVKTI